MITVARTGPVASIQNLSDRKSSFLGSELRSKTCSSAKIHLTQSSSSVVRAEKGEFDWLKKLGGRGLVPEDVLKGEKAREILFSEAEKEKEQKSKVKLDDLKGEIGYFGKELEGLTGGFPGGETGLKKFLVAYPPPKSSAIPLELQKAREQLAEQAAAAAGPPTPLPPPLLMPGMTVIVTKSNDTYFQFSGIVQRVTDGKVGVLFEGGNWDKLVTFDLSDVERTKKGPPASNPKSASLELDPFYKK